MGLAIRLFFVVGIRSPTREAFIEYILFNVPSHTIEKYTELLKEVLFIYFPFF